MPSTQWRSSLQVFASAHDLKSGRWFERDYRLPRIDRPYYLCIACNQGQFPADVQLDIDRTDFSPGVRCMLAAVGGEMPFVPGRKQLKLLADLEVTAMTIERTAESIGSDIEDLRRGHERWSGRDRPAIP